MYLNTEFCPLCKKDTAHYNGKCGICSEKREKERVRMWEAQDIETKITNLRQRIEKLEQGPMRF